MGCDIHAYLEFSRRYPPREEGEEETVYVTCFAEDVYIGRNYELFALMANVRYYRERMQGQEPVAKPKGVPSDASFQVVNHYTCWISDADSPDGSCTREQAESWIASGVSRWWDDDKDRITEPDWHSASWMTTDELKEVQRRYCLLTSPGESFYTGKANAEAYASKGAKISPATTPSMARFGEYYVEIGDHQKHEPDLNLAALIAAMEVLDASGYGAARLVFWFDN